MVTAFDLFIAVAVLFVVVGVILFTMQPEPHNKFDERYIEHVVFNPRLSRLGPNPNNRNAPRAIDLAKEKSVGSTLRDHDATALHNLHDHMADHLI